MAEARRVREHVAEPQAVAGDFTTFVVRMRDAGGEEVDAAAFSALWSSLRRALRTELIRRGLWNRPPAFLGIIGFARWVENGSEDDALDELTADCFSFVFLERIQALAAQLRLKPTIEGLVFRSIRNFLYERQKHHDPIGYRVFAVLREAVDVLVARGSVDIEPADAAIGNRTWLRFRVDPPARAPASNHELQETIEIWSDRLLPALIVGRGPQRQATAATLADLIAELVSLGVVRIRFRRIAEHLRQAVRVRWTALARVAGMSDDETPELGRLLACARPPRDLEERDSFTQLVIGVERRVLALDVDPSSRDHLMRLWSFARAIATDTVPWPDSRRYSRAAVAQALSIPRNRMPGLCAQLEGLIEECRSLP